MDQPLFEYSGFGYPSWWNGNFGSATSLASLQALMTTGSNSISIVPTSYITTITSSDFHATSQTESDANVRAQILQAHSLGLDVILKPHVDALDGSAFRGEFQPTDVAAWFAGYKDLVLRYAQIAAETGVKTFCIGCEYDILSGAGYQSYWVDIIDTVRQIYGGALTYASTSIAAKDVAFWDKVDLIGVNAYYSLSSSTTGTVEDFKAAWTSVPLERWMSQATNAKSPLDFLRDLSETYGKQVFMPEVGFRSLDGASINPGVWNTEGAVDLQEQEDLYQALFEVFTTHGGDWFAGLHLWNWDVQSWGTNNTAFSPQDKPALQVVTDWFTGRLQPTGLAASGTDVANKLHGGLGDDTLQGGLGDDILLGEAGDDLLIGGPDNLDGVQTLASTTLLVSARADLLSGIGAKFNILVNGNQVGGTFEAPATTTSSSITFANKGPVNSVGVRFINDEWVQGVADRNLYILGIRVNGNDLPITEAVNPTADGQGAMWFNSTLSINTSLRQDWFTGATTDDDSLYGGAGADTLIGGAGNDFLDGGDGIDSAVYGGLKARYAVSELGGGLFGVRDLRSGSPVGQDRLKDVEFLRFSDGTYSLEQCLNVAPDTGTLGDDNIVLAVASQSLTIDLLSGNDTLTLADGGNVGRVANVEQLLGGAGDDVITLLPPPFGMVIDLKGGVNEIRTADGGSSLQLLNVQTIKGGAGNDVITLRGATLSFTMDGGAGLDSLRLADGANCVTLANVETVTGGTGNDDVTLTTTIADVLVDLGLGADTLTLADGGNVVRVANVETIIGGTGNDVMKMQAAQAGFTVNLGAGQDELWLTGGDNTSIVANVEKIMGGIGTDQITLSTALTGGSVDLGAGMDRLTLSSTGANTITVFNTETVIGGGSQADTVTLGTAALSATFDLGGGSDALYLAAGTNSVSTMNVELVKGNSGADTITALGSTGVRLEGGAGNDVLRGGAGNDVIFGGADKDIMTGGADADRFLFTSANESSTGNPDVITDFNATMDLIAFEGVAHNSFSWRGAANFQKNGFTQARFEERTGLLSLDIDGNGKADFALTLTGVKLADLSTSDFLWG